jgi:hypothetical protein
MSNFGYVVLDQQTQTQTKISNNPGAWMFDGTKNNRWPVLHSTTDVRTDDMFITDGGSSYAFNDIDDAWFVLPGFKCEVYQHSSYTGIKTTFDNTHGTTVLVKKSSRANDVTSIKLFYKGTPL